MNCREWEERIASDLDDSAVARHVADCAGCQVFASGLRQALAELRAAHKEEIAPAHYAAVRARVMAELQPRRRWGWAWAAVAAGAIALAAVSLEQRMRVAELPRTTAAAVIPDAPLEISRAKGAGGALPPARGSVRKTGTRAVEQILVKIETSNPEVVIYWIAETKGDY